MGNETSSEDVSGMKLQTQNSELLWTIVHHEEEGGDKSVFTHLPEESSHADLCRAGVEHLRLLRHPNILKFLSCDLSHDHITMVTEPVVPLQHALEGIHVEGLVIGWRGVAEGLGFLHSKAMLSHNNVCSECVFVSTVNSQWKIGGFEVAQKLSRIDSQFLASVLPIRNPKAIPPEDQAETHAASHTQFPCHARDIWAFGQLILTLLEDTALEAHVSDTLFSYVQDEMFNSDPELRPTASELLEQPWMSTDATDIAEFLSKLTVKTKSEKDLFFSSLASRLHALPPTVVADHLVPLLVTPLVMAEPEARKKLWRHLLLPFSSSIPRQKVFDPNKTCPIFEKELYACHVLPLLLNLLECRELHVRLVLLENIAGYAPICEQEELLDTVLPEVLVGLKDIQPEVVQATLHALGDLVPLVGPEAVIGTTRRPIFADTKPRVATSSQSHSGSTPSSQQQQPTPSALGGPGGTSSHSNTTRKERVKQMQEKREEQRKKRMLSQNKKLGGRVIDGSEVVDEKERDESEEGSDHQTPATSEHAQYSPSVSHDEEEQWEGLEVSSKSGSNSSPHDERWKGGIVSTSDGGTHKDEECEEIWEDKMWTTSSDENKTGVQLSGGGGEPPSPTKSSSSLTTTRTLSHSSSTSIKSQTSLVQKSPSGDKNVGMRGRLRDEDIQRLEEKAAWATKEPDFFADMEPVIASSQLSLGSQKTRDITEESTTATSLSLQYQPGEEAEGEGWGEDGWDEF